MSEKQQKIHRRLTGIVVSTKMDKTALVRVDRTVIHPKYQKRYVRSAKYKVNDPKNELVKNDLIIFEECRPLSKGKCWRLVNKVK